MEPNFAKNRPMKDQRSCSDINNEQVMIANSRDRHNALSVSNINNTTNREKWAALDTRIQSIVLQSKRW